eukprot:CAMPEP_0172521288 /NCGR_PEP_ID=MMETSP1066-20121228/292498_1 /TAXON_ID=671091 /ORGANISM="Coscinodiscus wailesii, Strain CCMP2513" /LENGTH=496 /DNA_ID=CAMNT_0013304187 /DNA_START=56 /DNA_END=1546 /DNA_ORIENTATION=+
MNAKLTLTVIILCHILILSTLVCRGVSSSAATESTDRAGAQACGNNPETCILPSEIDGDSVVGDDDGEEEYEYEYDEDEDEDEDDDDEPDESKKDEVSGPECYNTDDRCDEWGKRRECELNPDFMLKYCPKSCGVCDDVTLRVGVEQVIQGENADITREVIRQSRIYLRNEVMADEQYKPVRANCINTHELCAFWATLEECEANPGYMKTNCALACQSCIEFLILDRCPLADGGVDSLRPHDLDRMFKRITDRSEGSKYVKYDPVVLSRPYPDSEGGGAGDVDYKMGPWVVIFDNFLTDEECDRLISLGGEQGYERSTNFGEIQSDGTPARNVEDNRTSENAWCMKKCYEDPIAKDVLNRIADFTGIPEANQEYPQILKYEVGQFYKQHHDYIPLDVLRQSGPRTLTFYLYLNDVVKGGGTKFNDLDLIVTPKKGRALLWPSVTNEQPSQKEFRSHHEALSVEEGVKYGANVWIHQREYKKPHANGCCLKGRGRTA